MKDKHNLNDQLAIERTKLAEERTHLAYIRTGLSLILGGLFFVAYFEFPNVYSYAGFGSIFLGLVFLFYGFYHHKKSKEVIDGIISTMFKFRR